MPRSLRALLVAALMGMAGTVGVAAPAAASTPVVSSRDLLDELTVAGETTSAFSSSAFPMWTAATKCNTRGQVLWTEALQRPTMSGCDSQGGAITGGKWKSPYDGLVLHHANLLTIDHLVSLSEAWRSGASAWDRDTRMRFANDLGYAATLVAVSNSVEAAKGTSGPQAWLPPVASYRCTYLKNWVAVKWRWQLSVDPQEKAFLAKKLTACGTPTLPIPTVEPVTVVTVPTTTPPVTSPPVTTPAPPTTAPPTSGGAKVDLNGVIEIPYEFDTLTGMLPRCGGTQEFSDIQVGITVSLWSGATEEGSGSVTGCQWVAQDSAGEYWSPYLTLRIASVPNITGLTLHIDGSPAVSLGAHLPGNNLAIVACDTNSNLLCVG